VKESQVCATLGLNRCDGNIKVTNRNKSIDKVAKKNANKPLHTFSV